MKGFGIYVQNDLLEPKHVKAMGSAVWEYMWCLDKMTSIAEDGIGRILGGKPVKLDDLVYDLGKHRNNISKNLAKLETAGYLIVTNAPHGLIICVTKAKKRFNEKVAVVQRKGLSRFNEKVDPIYIDNTVDNTGQGNTFKTNFKKPKANKNTMPAAKRLCKLFEEHKGGVFGGMHLTNAAKIIAKHGEVAVLDIARWCLEEYEPRQFEPVVKGPIDLGDHWDDLVDIKAGNRRGQPERKSRYGIKY